MFVKVQSIRRKSIAIHRKFLNKRNEASAFIIKPTAVTTQLIRSISKLEGTDFVEWQ